MNRGLCSVVAAVVILALPALAGAQRTLALQPQDFEIAALTDGMNAEEVRGVLGPPVATETADDSRAPGTQLVVLKYRDLLVILGSEDAVRGVWLTTRAYATARGVRVGDARARVEQLYGRAAVQDDTFAEYRDPAQPLHVIRVLYAKGLATRIFLGWLLD